MQKYNSLTPLIKKEKMLKSCQKYAALIGELIQPPSPGVFEDLVQLGTVLLSSAGDCYIFS